MVRRLVRLFEHWIKGRARYKFFLRDWIALSDVDACAQAFATMRFSRSLEPLVVSAPRGRRVVVLAPHGDDDVFGCGGTMLHAVAEGAQVHTIYFSAGKPVEEMRREIDAVATVIARTYENLDLPLGRFPIDPQTVERLRNAVAGRRPDVLFLPLFTDDHDDHRRVGELILAAFGETPDALAGTEIWAYQVYSAVAPNVVVDISDVAETKRAACKLFASQMVSRDWPSYVLGKDAFVSRFLPTQGRTAYAEGFMVFPAEEYLDVLRAYYREPTKAYYTPFYSAPQSA